MLPWIESHRPLPNFVAPLEIQSEASAESVALSTYAEPEAYASFLKGRLAERSGDSALAIEFYRRAAALAPQSPSILLSLSEVLTRKGDLPAAKEAAEQAVKIDSKAVRGYMILAGVASAANALDDAESAYCKVIALEPDNEEAYIYLSSIQAQARLLAH